jgi:peptidyl-prolyl cis-trans isomerase B (cyclophilin B)
MKCEVFCSIGDAQSKKKKLVLPLILATTLIFVAGCNSLFSTPAPEQPAAGATARSNVADLPPAERADYYQQKPDITIDTGKTYRATIQTNRGDIVVSLDAKAAPEHVNNFIFLSNEGFFDGLIFHRVEPGFVIQGGDPLGAGQGGPGYTIPGEFSLKHVEGALAMARLADAVNPDRESSGSQFYITLAPTEFLDGEYSVFGKVEEGMDVVRSIQVGDTINQIVVEP